MTTDGSLQLGLGILPAHNNQYLFSDHFLNTLLREEPAWRDRWEAALTQAEALHAWLQDHYRAEQAQLAAYNESQLEEHWFKPILTRLGHTFETQAAVPGLDAGIKKPDYVFFPDEAARQAAAAAQRTAEYAAAALAAGEVKQWDVPLGKKLQGGSHDFSGQNPSQQINYYLQTTELPWGILSNGRRWRLVHRDSSHRLTVYYEVDLVALLQQSDPGRLRYFTLFFRQAAFRPDAQGRRFLDDALAASNAYAVSLEEDLQANAYRALEHLLQGFLELDDNGLSAADLPAIYDNSLYLLYRLLFILYAESRGLLPLHDEQYREHYSLHDVKNDIAAGNVGTDPQTTLTWPRVQNLFRIVDGDNRRLNERLGVPRYNGGLFDPAEHPFLAQYQVGDRDLVAALDLLARREVNGQKEFADYRTLGPRQLGSIYEGLLEYRPRVAEVDLVAIRDGRQERWLPAAEAPARARIVDRRAPGQVYLQTDRGERKATGSYYTPQYIVEYIVANTLGPLVEAARQQVEEDARQVRGAAEKATIRQTLVDKILSLKILDPSMGSGHFLVHATEYLALELATDPYVQTGHTPEEDAVYWRRQVVERCIYGVDKNPLAVELAKLSLWLATIAADRPLSFLDHHLKHGDSLVGADVADLGWPPPVILSKRAQKQLEQQKAGQLNLFEYRLGQQLPAVMRSVMEIVGRESDSYETVQAKEAADRAVAQLKEPFVAVADLWVSAYFGNAYTAAEYGEALDSVGSPARLLAMPAVQRARELDGERSFFHWQLAFPKVFYDPTGQPLYERAGFDAVVGNPPYVSVTQIPQSLRDYILAHYQTTSGRFDLYIAFIERGIGLATQDGYFSFIVPIKWAIYGHGLALRRLFQEETTLLTLVDVSQSQVFPDPTTYPSIITVKNREPVSEGKINVVKIPPENPQLLALGSARLSEMGYTTEIPLTIFRNMPERIMSPLLDEHSLTIYEKLQEIGIQLGQLYRIEQCIRIGSESKRRKLITHARPRDLEHEYHPVIDGSEIFPYHVQWSGLYLHYIPSQLYNPKSPEILDRRKILIKRIAARLTAAYDDGRDGDHFYPLNTVYALIENEVTDRAPLFDLALLNSSLLDWLYKTLFAAIGIRGGYIEFREYLQYLPLYAIDFTAPPEDRARLADEAAALYDAVNPTPLTTFTAAQLQAGRADVIHDLLAHLAARMVAFNQDKHATTASFWLDLEGVAPPDLLPRLRTQGKWQQTLHKNVPAARPYVNENSRSTLTLDAALAWDEEAFKGFVRELAAVPNLSQVVEVYRSHQPAYAALTAHLAATDALIDRLVYQLYALTDEEIALVEGEVV